MTQNVKTSALKKARIAVERLLKIRLRSEQELIEKLRLKNIPDNVIDQIIKEYKELGLVDDVVFASAWIRSRLKKPFGPNRIKRELIMKGVAKEIIEEELSQATNDDYSEHDILLDLARRRYERYKGVEERKKKERVYGFLLRRGFLSSSIIRVIKEL